jgi:hypothetical protein
MRRGTSLECLVVSGTVTSGRDWFVPEKAERHENGNLFRSHTRDVAFFSGIRDGRCYVLNKIEISPVSHISRVVNQSTLMTHLSRSAHRLHDCLLLSNLLLVATSR